MPFSPIISKIRCHNPNKTGSRCANRNYAHYIATREGVDLSAINSIDDVISLKVYPDNDSTEKLIYIEADNHTYASYIANRPRSHGMFGNIDSTDLSSICATMEHLTTQHRNIYRGIVSLSEKDAKLLGMCDKSSWENYLHSVLPDIAKTLGISPTNFTWVAAFHAEESHPHVHYMLWDNRDRVCSPFIHISKQKHCRTILADNLFTKEYEKLIRELTKTERNEISPIKNESRNTIIHTFKDVFDSIPDYVPGTISDKLPSRISNALLNTLSVDLEKLISELPGSGSFKYQYMTPDIKKTINQISDKLYTHLDLKKELDTYLSSSEKLGQLIGEDTEDLKHRKSRDINDIYTRTGNIILKCTKILFEQYALEGIAAGDFSKSNKDPLSEAATNFQIDNIPPPEEVSINNNIGNERESDFFDVHSKNSDNYHDVDIDVDAGIEINQFENSNISFPSNDTNIYSTTKHYHNAYFFDWTPNYKKALDLLYNKNFSNYEFVTKLLFSEVQKKNVLAIYEIGKLRNKKLLPDSAPKLAQIYYKKALEGFLEIFNTLKEDNFNLESSEKKRQWSLSYTSYRIGKMYERGEGTEQDLSKAVSYYSKSENKFAQYSLGKMYLENRVPDFNDGKLAIKTAISLFRSSDSQKNPYAAFELGKLCDNNILTDKPDEYYKNALNGFLQIANSTPDDMLFYRIGKMYLNGKGCVPSEELGYKYIKRSADMNNEYAIYAMVQKELKSESPDISKAIKTLESIDKKDNSFIKYTLAKLYSASNSEHYNLEHAIELYTAAYELGNSHAAYALATIYSQKEDNVYFDMDKALQFWKYSADLDNSMAMYQLGKYFANSEHDGHDINTAIKWLEKSTTLNNEHAPYFLGKLYSNETLTLYDINKSLHYFQLAADRNNDMAMYRLGKYFANTENPSYDLNAALDWLKQAAALDNSYASYFLGCLYADPERTTIFDLNTAKTFWEKSAALNNDMAMYRLGKLYSNPAFSKINIQTTLNWYHLSAKYNNTYSQLQLGILYLYGKGMDKNRELGLSWINKSVENGNIFSKEVLNSYLKFEETVAFQTAYSIFRKVFSGMAQSNNQKKLELEHHPLASKQARKEAAKKNQIRGITLEE